MNALARRFGLEDEDLIQMLPKREQLIESMLRDGVMAHRRRAGSRLRGGGHQLAAE